MHLRPATAALLLLATACAGDDPTGPSYPDTVLTPDAWFVGQGQAGLADLAILEMNRSIPLAVPGPGSVIRDQDRRAAVDPRTGSMPAQLPTLPTLGAPLTSPPEGCTVTSHGGEDADANEVPDDWYYRQECYQTDSVSAPDTVKYNYTLLEAHLTQSAGDIRGWRWTERIVVKSGDLFGDYDLWTETDDIETSVRAGTATHHYRHLPTHDVVYDTHDHTLDFHYRGDMNFTSTFTPSVPIVAGTWLPSGTMVRTGYWREYNNQRPGFSFTISTPTPLQFGSACIPGTSGDLFESGVTLSLLNGKMGNPSATTTFAGCGANGTVTTEGTTDP